MGDLSIENARGLLSHIRTHSIHSDSLFSSLSYRYLFAAVLRFYTRRLTCVNVTFQRSTIESSKFSFSDRQRRQNDDKYIRTYVETDSTYILRYCAAAWLLLTMPDATVCSTHIWSIVSVEKNTYIFLFSITKRVKRARTYTWPFIWMHLLRLQSIIS